MELNLTFDIRPQAHQSVRMGRNGIAYTPKKIKDYKRAIMLLARNQLPKDFEIIPAGTAITVEYLHYIFEYTKSTPKKRRTYQLDKTTKPDLLDNINKAFIDALEGVVFAQDQNIVRVKELRKFYGERNKIEIKLVY